VSRANLGRDAALAAASALLVDYVLTVAVSSPRAWPTSLRPGVMVTSVPWQLGSAELSESRRTDLVR
jgi:hypothetical protein